MNSSQVAVISGGAAAASNGAVKRVLRISAFIAFTSLGAQLAVRLPFTPVPVTMQTLFVVLAGIALGPRDGFYAIASYVALGIAGVPVFAEFSFGPAVLLGPTGGYLAAFPAAALLAGAVSSRKASCLPAVFVSALCGLALILAAGALHLSLITGARFSTVLSLGVAPFLPGEILKAVLTVPLLGRWRGGMGALDRMGNLE